MAEAGAQFQRLVEVMRTVLKEAEDAKNRHETSLIDEMEVQGEVAGDPARVRELFGRLNVLRARLRESTPDVSEMPRPFSLKTRGKGSSGSGGGSGG